jgi:hypothetical protein
MDGAILVVSALDGPIPSDPGPAVRLEVSGGQAAVRCADANGNGQPGLVRIAASLADPQSGVPIPFSVETLPGQELDASGRYAVRVQLGEERTTRELHVRLAPSRSAQGTRRRRGPRRRRR